jgi:hypothetical protein
MSETIRVSLLVKVFTTTFASGDLMRVGDQSLISKIR